jgi:Spy/CpxP family protein refolding chaperone
MGGPHGEGGGHGHGGFLEEIADELGLTDAQREQAREILQVRFEQIREIREQVRSGSLTREQAREQIREIRESGREQIEQILTEEQREQLEAIHQERLEERIDARIDRLDDRLMRRASFLEQVLQLDAGQTAQLTELFEESIAARIEVLNQVKEGALEREDAFTQIRELEEQLAASIAALLTPEQLEVWEALRELHPKRGGRPH